MSKKDTLTNLCRNQSDIITRLQVRGVRNLEDLGELVPYDIMQLDLKDFVVRRRLLNWIAEFPKQELPEIENINDLCLNHARTISHLSSHGVQTLEDLKELVREDILEMDLINLVVRNRLLRYISNGLQDPVKKIKKPKMWGSLRTGSIENDVRVKSPKLR